MYKSATSKRLELKVLSFADLQAVMPAFEKDNPEVIFLGTEKTEVESNCDWFTLNITSDEDAVKVLDLAIQDKAEFHRAFPGMLRLNEMQSSIAAQSRGLLAWHQSHQFCSQCGSKSDMSEGGYKRTCANEACKTRQGNIERIL